MLKTKSADVFEQVLGRILSGDYPAGSRLPAERELADSLQTSRGTLREALRQLEGFGVLRARRGSGVEVLDYRRHGSLGLVPYFLRLGAPGESPWRMVSDLLYFRRLMAREVARLAAERGTKESLSAARAAFSQAWALRDAPALFLDADLHAFAALTRATEFLPLIWMVNTFLDTAREFSRTSALAVADPSYAESMEQTLALIEARRGEEAAAVFDAYFRRVDRHFLGDHS